MKITRLETIWIDDQPNTTWVRVHTDDGLIGLGETFYVPRAIAAMVHDVFANVLLGRNPLDIENHWANMMGTVNFFGFAGSEMRAISAIDVALWDIMGQHTGQPIYTLLGGRNRDRIRIYNTCVSHGEYQDFHRWREQEKTGELAAELLASGINCMKIWPFDQFGVSLGGPVGRRAGAEAVGPVTHYISKEQIKKGVSYVADIRNAVGDKMEIAIEGHAKWNLPEATKIARALEPYDIFWLEEIMPPDNPESYSRLKQDTTIPLCVSERLFTRFGFRAVVEQNAADIIMPDMAWTGGITETRKICSLADTYYLPITSHDTIGPVALWSAAHLMLHIPNALIMETVRAYYQGWYNDVMTDAIPISDGMLSLPERPGLGVALREEVLQRSDVHIEVSDINNRRDMSKG
ncbi:MAG: mandelate racemase/muconate lactonizing enzyme family protein [Chloroflexi bacterium]|nr:mandelate racemase/muconate lactonizing enzyme family protein [Chloroflexota bacterium]MCC6893868.1 mandelate racemase/muconate lactonizing enzyme family protein [Anaerolineae bacterium]